MGLAAKPRPPPQDVEGSTSIEVLYDDTLLKYHRLSNDCQNVSTPKGKGTDI